MVIMADFCSVTNKLTDHYNVDKYLTPLCFTISYIISLTCLLPQHILIVCTITAGMGHRYEVVFVVKATIFSCTGGYTCKTINY